MGKQGGGRQLFNPCSENSRIVTVIARGHNRERTGIPAGPLGYSVGRTGPDGHCWAGLAQALAQKEKPSENPLWVDQRGLPPRCAGIPRPEAVIIAYFEPWLHAKGLSARLSIPARGKD